MEGILKHIQAKQLTPLQVKTKFCGKESENLEEVFDFVEAHRVEGFENINPSGHARRVLLRDRLKFKT